MVAILLALLPILVFMVLLVGVKTNSALAAACSLVTAIAVGTCYFTADWSMIYGQSLRGGWNALTIFTVIAPAILIYELLLEADLFTHIKYKVEAFISDDLLRILLIGWAFSSFLQSITGFGVPVAVAAPILVSLGVSPMKSVFICILGHAWGGTFGTLAIAWDSLFLQVPAASGYAHMALYTCLMLWLYNLVCGLLICFVYKGKNTKVRDLMAVGLLSLLQGGGQLLFAELNTSTACFMASILSIVGVFVLNRFFYRPAKKAAPATADQMGILPLIFPFLVLTILVVFCLFIPQIYQFLGQWQVGLPIPDGNGALILYAPVAILTHSGTLLLATGVISMAYYHKKQHLAGARIHRAVSAALRKAGGAILPILLLIIMSKVMDGTGQIYVLANGIAELLGGFYPLVAPLVGILGAFISSSNMSSNILFAGFQNHVAELIHVDAGAILAAQTAGGSIGNLTATSNIVLGLATTGESGKEGQVMHFMLPVALVLGLLLGAITYLLCLPH